MKVKKLGTHYIIRLDSGEEIVKTLTEFAQAKKIKSAFLLGLGAAKELTLGFYDLEKKAYIRRFFPTEWEITNLVGNIAWLEEAKQSVHQAKRDEPILHIHIVLSSSNFNTIGGHLFSGTVTATCEILIMVLDAKLKRSRDSATGLNLLTI